MWDFFISQIDTGIVLVMKGRRKKDPIIGGIVVVTRDRGFVYVIELPYPTWQFCLGFLSASDERVSLLQDQARMFFSSPGNQLELSLHHRIFSLYSK